MQCRYCGMDNRDHTGICVSCNGRLQGGSYAERQASTGPLRASHRSHPASSAELKFAAPDPVFRSSKFAKGSRLTGSASTASIKTQASDRRASAMPGQWAADAPLPAAERPRNEPHFDDKPGAFANSSKEELQRQYAFYDRFNAPPPRSRPSIVYVIAVFAIGAVVGVTGTWLGSRSSGDVLENELPHAPRNARAPGIRGAPGSVARGIDPRELPYDGLAPAPSEQAAQAPPFGIDPQERPYAQLSSSSRVAQQDKAPSDTRRKNRQAAVDEDMARNASAAGVKKAVTAKTAQKRRSTHRRVAKDREIERIRQQAAEELKKKTDGGRSVKQHGDSSAHRSARRHEAPVVVDRSARTRAMLASCERAGNFFLREKCKWRLCGGSWGEHGCPSYQTQASSY